MHYVLTTHSDQNPLIIALRELGVDVKRVDWPQAKIDLCGCCAFYGNLFDEIRHWVLFPRLLNLLRDQSIPYVFWNRDAPWDTGIKFYNKWILNKLRPADIYLTHSMQNSENYGKKAFYFPNAASEEYFKCTDLLSLRDECSYLNDLSFFGSVGGYDLNALNRRNFLNELTDAILSLRPGVRVKIVDTSKTPMPLEDQCSLIRQTKINLNFGAMCDLPGVPSWGLPERVFGIPAAGGFPLTDYRSSLELSFSNVEYPSFSTLNECAVKVDRILESFSGMRAQAELIHKAVIEAHTYKNRAEYFMEIIETGCWRLDVTKDC